MRTLAAVAPRPPERHLGINLTRAAVARVLTQSPEEREAFIASRWTDPSTAGVVKDASGVMGSSSWSENGPNTAAGRQFIEAVLRASAFGAIAQRARPASFLSRTVALSDPTTAFWLGERQARAFSSAATSFATLSPHGLGAALLTTQEALKDRGLNVEAGLTGDLIRAVADALDIAMFDVTLVATGISPASITSGVSPVHGGSVANAVMAAIDEHEGDLRTSVVVTSPLNAARLAILHGQDEAGVNGGSVAGLPLACSVGIGNGYAALIDCAGIAINLEAASIDRLEHVTIEAETAPDSPVVAGTEQVSLWQHNLVALAVQTWVGWQVVRPGAVTVATVGDSPL